jgi:hypothetical protein
MNQRVPRRRAQFACAVLGVLALLALRLASAWSLRVDSDEPQYLHVSWAWTQGFLPYRDFFDNHTPLFQLLMSPLLALLGARADIVPCMRTAMIPFWVLGLALTWWLGRRLWNVRVAWTATALTALFPLTYVASAQFRTGDLWWVIWVAAVGVAAVGAPRRGWLALSGLLAGLAFAISMKSSPLLLTQLLALAMLASFWRLQGHPIAWRAWLLAAPGWLLGLVLPLGAFAVFFALHDALPQAWYFWVTYNIVPGLGNWSGGEVHYLLFPAVWLLLALMTWRRLRDSSDPQLTLRRLLPFTGGVLYLGALFSFWPLLTLQDLLPVMPLILLGITGTRLGSRPRVTAGFVIAFVLELAVILAARPPWRDHLLHQQERDLAAVLRLTRPGDYVMDAKGEAIFRQRPVFWVFEDIARYRIAHGLLHPQVRAHMVRTGTPLLMDYRMPREDRGFIEHNYLPVRGNVRVLGVRFRVATAGQAVALPVAVGQSYVLVSAQGPVHAQLDGREVYGPLRLAPGCYRLSVPQAGAYTLLWAPALARGLTLAGVFAHPGAWVAAPFGSAAADAQCAAQHVAPVRAAG